MTFTGMSSRETNFNPRLPRGRRLSSALRLPTKRTFQSTPPSREATWPYGTNRTKKNFNPRLPRGRRRFLLKVIAFFIMISIHASLAGGDRLAPSTISGYRHFNPRLPRGRRQGCATNFFRLIVISIHASLAGGDLSPAMGNRYYKRFQSTPPSREATEYVVESVRAYLFQSTPPSREATFTSLKCLVRFLFQSTPPSREATI